MLPTRPVLREPRNPRLTSVSGAKKVTLGVAGATVVLLLWSRLAQLDASLWHDEAYTVLNYVNGGPREIFFGDYRANNHVLFSLLTWATTGIVGHFDAAYRLWSVIPALGAVALVAWWTWRRLSPVAAAAVVVLATMSPLHFTLAPQARGYGLTLFAAAGMLVAADRASERGRVADVVLFGVFALVGTWTYPLFVLAVVFQAAVLAIQRDLRRPVLATCGVAAAGTLLFYWPMLGRIVEQAPQRHSEQLPWYGPVSGPFNDLARPMLTVLFPERVDLLTSHSFVAATYVLFAALGVRWLWRHEQRALLAHLVVPVVGTYLTLTVARFYLKPRFTSFLLFYVIVLLSLGVVELWHVMRHVSVVRPLIWAAIAAVVLVGSKDVIAQTRIQAEVPYENFKFVSQIVNESGIDRVMTNSRASTGLQYYLGSERLKVEDKDKGTLVRSFCYDLGPFIFVDHNGFGSPDPNLTCLRLRGAARVHVHQQARGSMDVWLVSGSNGAGGMAAEAFAADAFCRARADVQTELSDHEPDTKTLSEALARLVGFAPAVPEQARPWADRLREGVFIGRVPSSPAFENASQTVEWFCRSQTRP
jgi:hypothetical protein